MSCFPQGEITVAEFPLGSVTGGALPQHQCSKLLLSFQVILHRVVNFTERNSAPRNFNRGFHNDQWCGDPRAHHNMEEYYNEGHYPSNDSRYYDNGSSGFHRNPPPSRNVRRACYAWLNEPRAASTGWKGTFDVYLWLWVFLFRTVHSPTKVMADMIWGTSSTPGSKAHFCVRLSVAALSTRWWQSFVSGKRLTRLPWWRFYDP